MLTTENGEIMHARMNMLIGDPARVDEAVHYLETTVRPHVEAVSGSRGLAIAADRDLGLTLIASYWENAEAMTASEHAVQTSRKEATELANGVVTVERFEVPIFVRRSRPGPGAGVRLTMLDGNPAEIETAIDAFRSTALPGLREMPRLCSAQLLVDRATGRSVVITVFEDAKALADSRGPAAKVRSDMLAKTHTTVRSMQELSLVSTSVREGGTNSLTEREAEMWNTHDIDSWRALLDQQAFEVRAPGGMRMAGREAIETFWNTWNEAFPDNQVTPVGIYGDEHGGVLEGRFTGTHSGTLRSPSGEIPATGKPVDLRFAEVHRVEGGKIIDFHVYFDQLDLLGQLGQQPTRG